MIPDLFIKTVPEIWEPIMFNRVLFSVLSLSICTTLTAVGQTRGDRGSNNIDAQIEQATSRLANRILEQRDHYSLDMNSKQNLLAGIRSALTLFRTQPNPGPVYPRPPMGGSRMQVETFSDYTCSTRITALQPQDQCSSLGAVFQSATVSAIRLEGTCIDISNQSFRNLCPNLLAMAQQPATQWAAATLYSDYTCSNKVMDVDPRIDYRPLGSILSGIAVSAVRVEGECVDIDNVTISTDYLAQVGTAAGSMRNPSPFGETIELYSDYTCSTKVTHVNKGDRCDLLDQFFRGKTVSAVRFRGQCVDIDNVNFGIACSTYSR
jgi:hypothetical protein